MARLGSIKHDTRSRRKSAWARGKGFTVKHLKVTIKLDRWTPGLRGVKYTAQACFFPGWKVGDSYRRADGKLVALNKRRVRLYDRCGNSGWQNSPTKAVQKALAALSKKKL